MLLPGSCVVICGRLYGCGVVILYRVEECSVVLVTGMVAAAVMLGIVVKGAEVLFRGKGVVGITGDVNETPTVVGAGIETPATQK